MPGGVKKGGSLRTPGKTASCSLATERKRPEMLKIEASILLLYKWSS